MSLALSQSWRSPTGVMANCLNSLGSRDARKLCGARATEKLINSIQESIEAMLPV
jgi:hypothetical protein